MGALLSVIIIAVIVGIVVYAVSNSGGERNVVDGGGSGGGSVGGGGKKARTFQIKTKVPSLITVSSLTFYDKAGNRLSNNKMEAFQSSTNPTHEGKSAVASNALDGRKDTSSFTLIFNRSKAGHEWFKVDFNEDLDIGKIRMEFYDIGVSHYMEQSRYQLLDFQGNVIWEGSIVKGNDTYEFLIR